MKLLKNKWFLLLFNLLLAIVLFLIFASDHSFLQFIDTFSYITAAYLLTFLFMFVKKSGFYDGIVFSFRRFNHVMFKKNEPEESWRSKPAPSENTNLTVYQMVRFQGITLLIILIILLVIFYSI